MAWEDNDWVQALAINPSDTSKLFAGTRFKGLFMSANSAGSWSPANSGLKAVEISALAFDPLDPLVLYAGSDGGVFKSIDKGASWSFSGEGMGRAWVLSLMINPAQPLRIYAGTQSGVYRSTNGGASW